MSSVGTICFEDRFSTSRKGGVGEVGGCCTTLADSAWRVLQLAIERAWSELGWPVLLLFCAFLAFRQLSVWRSVPWTEGPDC